jgi:pyrrolidone-carboxylate peptidase
MVRYLSIVRVTCAVLFICSVIIVQGNVSAQVKFEPEGAPLPDYYRYHPVCPERSPDNFYQPRDNTLPIIMLTGYWPPTNEMLRQFSPNPDQNPDGWAGDNWESRGYNIYAFFPEFPHGLGKGEGDFEVDYQKTSDDWWYYTELLEPIAVISFGRAFNNHKWTLEGGARNHHMNDWFDDYEAPFKPDITLPIVSEPPGFDRFSSLPLDEIVIALNNAEVPVNPETTQVDASKFLCNFIGYHACWYYDTHSSGDDPARNVSSGHVHVGYAMSLETAEWATEVTVRTLIDHVDSILCTHSGDVNGDGQLTAQDAQLAFFIVLGSYIPTFVEACAADCMGTGEVTAADAQAIFLSVIGADTCQDPLLNDRL